MKFKGPLTEATLLKRYFRFLVDVFVGPQQKRTLYCPNLGPLTYCDVLGSRVWFSKADRLSHGYLDVWELCEVDGGWLVCVNPNHADILVREALAQDSLLELVDFRFLQAVIVPNMGNGIELLLKENGEQCFIHIEPVLAGDQKNNGFFPEERGIGSSALYELIALRESGHKAVLLYCVLHNGIRCIRPADFVDPHYSNLLREAVGKGVEVLAYRVSINLQEIKLDCRIPVLLSEDIILE